MKKQSNLSRLLEIAGSHKYLTYASWVLSAISALIALVPFYYIWKMIKEVLEVAPNFGQAQSLTGNGWMAVLFAVIAVLVYIAGLIDEMVEIEVDGTHAYQDVLRQLGRPSPHIDPSLEHILITGMFHTFFELIIHEMPLKDAENYVREMRAFYTAGWMKIMGQ